MKKSLNFILLMMVFLGTMSLTGCDPEGSGDSENTGAISGKITLDGSPLKGAFTVLTGDASIDYFKKTIATDAKGEYRLESLKNGTYKLKPILKGHAFSPETITIELSDKSMDDADFEAFISDDIEPVWDAYYDTSEHNGSLENLDGYTTVSGELIIQNTALENLYSLSHLKTVERLLIIDNAFLTSLEGLGNLSFANHIQIIRNGSLKDLSGFGDIASVDWIYIAENNGLTGLEGVENFTYIKGLRIIDNKSLASVKGLENITFDSLHIIRNNALTSLDGLYANTSVADGYLYIDNNKSLSDFDFLDHLTSFSDGLKINSQDKLTNLLNFRNITSMASLSLGDVPLESLEGLEKLTNVQYGVSIYNTEITNLEGLNNVSYIGADLYIHSNPRLLSLKGLNQLSSLDDLYLNSNHSLESLEGLTVLKNLDGIYLYNNDTLTDLEGLYNIQSLFFGISICLTDLSNNGSTGTENIVNDSLTQDDVTNLVNHIGRDNIGGQVYTTYPNPGAYGQGQ